MPKRKPDADTLIENILESHDPEVRALVEHLRKIIRETVPDATESAHPVWHSIGYRHPESGYFCGIFPQNDGVNLAFEFGVLLPDPGGSSACCCPIPAVCWRATASRSDTCVSGATRISESAR